MAFKMKGMGFGNSPIEQDKGEKSAKTMEEAKRKQEAANKPDTPKLKGKYREMTVGQIFALKKELNDPNTSSQRKSIIKDELVTLELDYHSEYE